VLVCGDRHWRNREKIYRYLDKLREKTEAPLTIIEGCAQGADRMAGEWAADHRLNCMQFPAQWDRYGRAAGPIRNQQMLDEGKPELVVAFHPDLTQSKGTLDMVVRSRKANIRTVVVK
jgi:hypothetical protein